LLGEKLDARIGFLVAAKSVLRFKEAENQALAEYILIGTRWSFTLTIALSWVKTQALTLFPSSLPIPSTSGGGHDRSRTH